MGNAIPPDPTPGVPHGMVKVRRAYRSAMDRNVSVMVRHGPEGRPSGLATFGPKEGTESTGSAHAVIHAVQHPGIAICRLKRVGADLRDDVRPLLPWIPVEKNGKRIPSLSHPLPRRIRAGPAAGAVWLKCAELRRGIPPIRGRQVRCNRIVTGPFHPCSPPTIP